MEITDFAKGVMWGMPAERFDLLQRRFFELHPADLESFVLKLEAEAEEKDYEIINGVAVIPVSGVITKRASFFSYLFGGVGVNSLTEILQAAITDPDVSALLLNIDSPGGTVNGIDALSQVIYEMKSQKPIVAYANGMMASAAYWLGSSADAVITDKTADVGSIGVLMIHTDFSEADKKYGIKTTYLTAGKYKALGNDAEPLSDLARETFQAELDYIYGIFVDAVARNRDVSAEEVRSIMAEGKIFIGQQAVDAGLADYVGTLDDAHELALSMVKKNKQTGGMLPGKETYTMFEKKIVAPSTLEELVAIFPQMAADIRDQGVKGVDVAGAVKAAVDAETGRIIGLVSAQFGEDAGRNFAGVVASGMTGNQLAAYKILNPEKPAAPSAEDKKKAELLVAIQKAGADNPGAGDGGGSGVQLSVEDQAKKDFATKQDIRDEFKTEGAYVAFKTAEASGKIRILKSKV